MPGLATAVASGDQLVEEVVALSQSLGLQTGCGSHPEQWGAVGRSSPFRSHADGEHEEERQRS